MIPSKQDGRPFIPSERPHSGELRKRIVEALELVRAGKWMPVDVVKCDSDFQKIEAEFGVETTLPEEQKHILESALEEITPDDYAGHRPPEKSREPIIKGKEMFAFCWESAFFNRMQMFLKFSLRGEDESRRYVQISIHQSKRK